MINRTLSHYRILEQIGAGGMGVVYRARDEHLLRDVALKILPAGVLADEAARRRFRQEALSLSRLSHPNIETVHDFDTQEGLDFLVLEYVPGITLSDRLAEGPLPGPDVVTLGRQLAEALAAAHARGVVHRDLKPHNLRLTPDGLLKVLDFGLARLLETPDPVAQTRTLLTEGPVGTPPYMAPEQLRGEAVDGRTDIYAAGAVLYEMATGRPPFGDARGAMLTEAILHRDPPRPDELNPAIPAGLSRVILRALAKRPGDRQQSAWALRDELQGRHLRATWPFAVVPARRRSVIAAAVVLGGLLIGFAGYRWIRPGPGLASLAVLPFANGSSDPEVEYMSDGLTDGIINSVSTLPRLKVIAWASVSRYKGRPIDPRKVGRELDVGAVLAGRVSFRSERLLVSAELVDASDSRHLWGAQYDRKFSEVSAIQGEIAQQISENLRVRLTGAEEKRLTRQHTGSPEAYQLYLRGRHALLTQFTGDGMKRAIDYFQKAIDVDPQYALPYAGLADCYYGLSNIYLPPTEAMPRSKAAALKALALDDALGEAHASLGVVKAMHDWDQAGADREFERAIMLSPSDASAHLLYGMVLTQDGRTEEALQQLARARELDPLSSFIRVYGVFPLYLARQYDRAEKELRRLIAVEPDFYLPHAYLGLVLEQTGGLQEAIAELRTASRLDDTPEPLAQLGHALALAGDRAEARRILERLRTMSDARYISPYNIAIIFVGLGERDQALAWLDKAVDDRSEWIYSLRTDPRLDALRSDPRFNAILRRTGLPPV